MPETATRRKAKTEEPTPEPIAEQADAPAQAVEEAQPPTAATIASTVADTLPVDPEPEPEPPAWEARSFAVKNFPDCIVLSLDVAGQKTFYQTAQELQTQLFDGLREQLEADPCVVRAREADKRLAAARARDAHAQAQAKAVEEEYTSLLASDAPPEDLPVQLAALESRKREAQAEATAGAVTILVERSAKMWAAAREELATRGRSFADDLAAGVKEQLDLEYDRLVSRNQFSFQKLAVLNRLRNGRDLRGAAEQAVRQITAPK